MIGEHNPLVRMGRDKENSILSWGSARHGRSFSGKSDFVLRVRLLLGGILIVAFVLVGRLYFVQIVEGEEWLAEASAQYVAPIVESDRRGDILFSDQSGRLIAAATTKAGYRVAIAPDLLTDSQTFEKLSAIIELDEETFRARAAKAGDPYEEIAERVSEEQIAAIHALDLDGVIISQQHWRFYPADSLASHVIGFTGFRGHDRLGRYGLERYFEDTLNRGSSNLYVNFFAELFSSAYAGGQGSASHGDLITSIDPPVQLNLERTLEGIADKWNTKNAGGIIMDPKSGEIVGMAAHPTFDLNKFSDVEDAATYSNPLVERVYELGSIMKPITMAAGLDAGVVTPKTEYNDLGCIMKSGARICNYDGEARGRVDMQQVLSQSLNTGASFVADKIGHDEFAKYLRNFGLGEETGVDLPGEVAGLLGALDSGSDVDYASASFGQSIAVTPIAMIRALAGLANDGILPEPHVVKAVRYKNGITRPVHFDEGRRVTSPEAAHTVTDMLVNVVDDALLEGVLKQEHYSIAAKTGTAQIASPGGYYDDRYLHSFFGYFPAKDPKFIIFLFALEPQGVKYASQTLAHPFMDLTKFIINYYNIPPDR